MPIVILQLPEVKQKKVDPRIVLIVPVKPP